MALRFDAGERGREASDEEKDQRQQGDMQNDPNARQMEDNDFRKMLETQREIDAVMIATPDHNHAVVAMMALKMGKHVFCQKPLTHSVAEALRLAQAAKEAKVATQMGNQGSADAGLRTSVEIVQSGAIGPVREVHVWTNRPVWPQAPQITERPKDTPSIPKHVHWDLFLGPAPERPYHPAYHPFAWRGWWDFGTGALGDMACHTMNMPFMGLDLRDPVSVEAVTSGHNKDSYPARSKIKYEFAATANRPALVMYWYDGGNLPSKDGKYSQYCAVIVKKVDAQTRSKTGINELLRGD